MRNNNWFRPAFVQGTLALGGLFYILAGVALLVAPVWFLETVGPFAPFNRHYMGDAGSFSLALGVGLLLASRDPLRNRVMLIAGLVGTLIHTVNHAYGDLVLAELSPSATIRDLVPLVIFAVLLVVAYLFTITPEQPASRNQKAAGIR